MDLSYFLLFSRSKYVYFNIQIFLTFFHTIHLRIEVEATLIFLHFLYRMTCSVTLCSSPSCLISALLSPLSETFSASSHGFFCFSGGFRFQGLLDLSLKVLYAILCYTKTQKPMNLNDCVSQLSMQELSNYWTTRQRKLVISSAGCNIVILWRKLVCKTVLSVIWYTVLCNSYSFNRQLSALICISNLCWKLKLEGLGNC